MQFILLLLLLFYFFFFVFVGELDEERLRQLESALQLV